MFDNSDLRRAFDTIVGRLTARNRRAVAAEIEYLGQFVDGKLSPISAHWANPEKRERIIAAMKRAGKARRKKLLVVNEHTGEEQIMDYEGVAALCGRQETYIMNRVSVGGGKTTLQTRQSEVITVYKSET